MPQKGCGLYCLFQWITKPLPCWINYDVMPTSNFQPIRLHDPGCWYEFTYLMTNSVDPDQLASTEAYWSGSIVSKCRAYLGPVVQSLVSLTSSLRVISLTVLSDSIHNILIFFAEKNVSSFAKATHIFFSKKFQHIFVSLDVNFNKSLTNNVVSFEQLGPDFSRTRVNLYF